MGGTRTVTDLAQRLYIQIHPFLGLIVLAGPGHVGGSVAQSGVGITLDHALQQFRGQLLQKGNGFGVFCTQERKVGLSHTAAFGPHPVQIDGRHTRIAEMHQGAWNLVMGMAHIIDLGGEYAVRNHAIIGIKQAHAIVDIARQQHRFMPQRHHEQHVAIKREPRLQPHEGAIAIHVIGQP